MTNLKPLSITALVVTVLIAGCSETAMIRSKPSGAQVYINDRPAGTTPFAFAVVRGDLEDSYRLRLEKEGYAPYTGMVRTRIAPGRLTAAVFTFGIVYLFKSPWCLVPPERIVMRLTSEGEWDQRVGKELREIKKLRSEGKISQEEFDRRSKDLLDGQR